jgi:hypothetical protein
MREMYGGRRLVFPRPAWFLSLLVMGAVAGPASATIIPIPAGQPNIRAAVAAAASGDTILLAPGTHSGGAYINDKALTIASQFLLTGDTTVVAQTILSGVASGACGGGAGCVGNAVLEYGANAHGSVVVGLTLTGGENGIASGSIMDVSHCRVIQNGDGVDYVIGAGGTISNCLFQNNSDDGIDLNGRLSATITNNLIRNNADDGIEFRLYAFSGAPATVDIIANTISGNGEDGIQIIDYPGTHPYVMRVERNLLSANFDGSGLSAGIGIMPNGDTIESLVGAPMAERLYVIHNTFVGEKNGLVGGANVIALNNIFTGTQGSAIRRVSGNSIVSYAMLWNNGIHYETSVVDAPHMIVANPVLDPGAGLTLGSPAIDAGTASYQWLGETVLNLPPTAYQGPAPDLGATEFGGIVNTAPTVNAGVDHTVTLPAVVVLNGSVEDDGLPNPPASLETHWSVVTAAGPMAILDPSALVTQATFSLPGSYVLRLAATDGTLIGSDLIAITVAASSNAAPTVEAGPPQTITLPSDVTLAGAASDDGLPNPPATFSTVWAKSSGPGIVAFQNAALVNTHATFSLPGTYQLVLIASDGALSGRDSVLITVQPEPNTTPQVNAGPDKIIALPSDVALDGTVSDDGHPLVPGTVTTSWTKVSGPGPVTFQNAALVDTRAAFTVAGTYVLRLHAFDGALFGSDLVQVTVQPANTAPVVDAGPSQTIMLPSAALLDATVTDDGYPSPPAFTSATWSKGSGPGTVTFGSPNVVDTQASFSLAGTYILRLTANDGALSVTDSVQITVQPQPPPIDRRIAVAADDVEEEVPAGTISGNITDIELVTGTTLQVVGLRFPNLTVPPGMTILTAYIQFQADEVQSEATSLTIKAHAADNAPAFTTAAFNVSVRPRTTASATWTPPAWTLVGEQGPNQRTPELKDVLQEIVNRPGWASGNAVAIIITGTGHRTARSFEGLASGAALLHIEMGGAPPLINSPPVVDAGPNQTITLPAGATLDGTVSDDELPNPPSLVTVTWTKGSGPGIVTFTNPNAVDTQASFSLAGTYILRLTASDGGAATTDSVQITVNPMPNQAPAVDAGPNRVINLPASASLDGTVSDDGLPNPPGAVTTTWSKGSGPGTVTFVNANAVDTQASFSLPGVYILRLTANDGALSRTDSMQVTANPANTAPVVDAGPNQTITLPASASLDGTVSDDGQPSPPALVTVAWTKWSGPGTVTFANANAVDTQASFSVAGTYVLRLTASDGALGTVDSVQVTVLPQNFAPTVSAGLDKTIVLPASASLDGNVDDDGLPAPASLTTTWSAVSGPGAVTFVNASAVVTQASFTAPGIYQLRLNASDGALSAADTMQVTVMVSHPVERRIAASTDDAEESATGTMNLASANLQLVFNASNQTVGMRFSALAIPQGAQITTAYVQFAANLTESGATSLVVRGQAADNAAAFTGANLNASSRPRTADSVSWTPPAWTTVGQAGLNERTPELKTLVQEVVNRPGWASGNALALIIRGTGVRTAYSFDGNATQAPLLHVEYASTSEVVAALVDSSDTAPGDSTGGGSGDPGGPPGGEIPGGADGDMDGGMEGAVDGVNGLGGDAVAGPGVSDAAPVLAVPAPRDLTLKPVRPSPSRGGVAAEFGLPHGQAATLELIDIAGRRIAAREVGSLGAGWHRIDLAARLPAGVYVVRLAQAGRALTTKVAVVR